MLSRDETYHALLSQEATKCKMAFETFLLFQEKVIVNQRPDDITSFLSIDRYTAWISHLYEVLKLCVSKELSLPPDGAVKALSKRMIGETQEEKASKAAAAISNYIEECGSKAVNMEGPHLDKMPYFNEGFSKNMKKIRDKYFAHPTKSRLNGEIFDQFTSEHHFTALCSYKQYALCWADMNGFYGEARDSLMRAQHSITNIPKRFRES